MKCPVCKADCLEQDICTRCGFKNISPIFINQAEADNWIYNVVEPYRKTYYCTLSDWTIENDTVVGCKIKGKRKLEIPYGIKKIAYKFGCDNKVSELILPNTLRIIEARTFAHKQIDKVNFPEGMEEIGEYAFNSCPLQSVELPSTIRYLGDHCLDARQTTISIDNPYYYIENDCLIERETGKLLFVANKDAENIVIPDAVKIIGVYAFGHCERLKTVTIPDGVETILRGAFFKCEKLERIILPRSIAKIERYIVEQCYCLRDIFCDFYEGDVELDEQWLDACTGLAKVWWKDEWVNFNEEPFPL